MPKQEYKVEGYREKQDGYDGPYLNDFDPEEKYENAGDVKVEAAKQAKLHPKKKSEAKKAAPAKKTTARRTTAKKTTPKKVTLK